MEGVDDLSQLTPMMQQYTAIKNKYMDCLLFFRLGDFYEMFNEDAKTASRELEITLTARNKGSGDKTPMAGVPHHSADTYIAQLVKKGYKVAICEQLEDPSSAAGIVRRDVVRVITPGTIIDGGTLEDNQNNYLAALIVDQRKLGFAYVDISTGEFAVTELAWNLNQVIDELSRVQPAELIISEELAQDRDIKHFLVNQQVTCNIFSGDLSYQKASQTLIQHFQTKNLHGFGCQDLVVGIIAAGAIIDFLLATQKRSLYHLNTLKTYFTQEYMVIDAATRRNLELTTTIRDRRRRGSLLGVLDRTVTALGGRKLKQWINQPLLDLTIIQQRLNTVADFQAHLYELDLLRDIFKNVYDIERLLSRVVYGSANARDLIALKLSLRVLPEIAQLLDNFPSQLLISLRSRLDLLEDVAELIEVGIANQPPAGLKDGGLIKDGYHQKLDRLRDASANGKEWIVRLEQQERARTGIKSLKVGFNKVFGYYLEITKANLHLTPENYHRKQTLANAERFITPELKEKESLILEAAEKSVALEYDLFIQIREKIAEQTERIQETAIVLAELDVLSAFAVIAIENNYCQPQMDSGEEILIVKGRHPVVEELLTERFVPNDTFLNAETARFALITGPNMSGKSTYMRQVALIVLLAQIGSFVPAEEAKIGLVDRIFTRVGASDDLTTGQSTFMVEMNEVANIVHHASKRSLIILDEVGRGTSTYDGLSIAWAVIEYIHDRQLIGARTLFATHYHELTVLEEQLNGLRNFNIAVEESQDTGVVFRHEIIPGAADQSYGIEVARLAGLPKKILERAQEILHRLEGGNLLPLTEGRGEREVAAVMVKDEPQMSLFHVPEHAVVQRLRELDLLQITPLEALNILDQLKREIEKE